MRLTLLRFAVLPAALPCSLLDCIRRFVGTGIAFLPERYGPVTEPRRLATCCRRAVGDDLAAVAAGRRDRSRAAGRRWRSLRDRARPPAACCPGRAAFQGVQQPAVVARVQADRRLVEHVEHAAQAAADLAARRMRCISPPESVGAGRASVRYSRPDVDQELQRDCGSRGSDFAGDLALGGRRASRPVNSASSLPSGRRQISSIVRPRNRTAAASSRSRLPPQTEHSTSSTRCSSSAAEAGRNAAGFFERRIEALVLEAKAGAGTARRAALARCSRLAAVRASTSNHSRRCRA